MNSVRKLDALTSLRFFAAAMIVLGHSHPLFGSFGIATHFSLSQGVSFFFTLSGFILAYNYKSLPDARTAKRFIVSRFARIWPLHIATLVLWMILITPRVSMEFGAPMSATAKLIANITLLQSWTLIAPYVLSFNGVAWSISTEAFFYVAFILIALNPTKRFPSAIILSALCTLGFIYAATYIPLSSDDGARGISMFGVLYVNPLTRLLEFLFGVYCAKLYRAKAESAKAIPPIAWFAIEIAALASIIFALYVVANPFEISKVAGAGMGYYVYKEGIWALWGALILVFAWSRGPIASALSLRPLVFLGEISFALYLVHMIIFNLAELNAPTVRSFGSLGMLLFWIVCICSASALHIAVENPCRRLIVDWWDGKHSRSHKATFGWEEWLCLAIIAVGSIFASTYQPSTVVGIDPSTTPNSAKAVPANSFSSGMSLIKIGLSPAKNGNIDISLYFTLQKNAKLNRHIGVHLNDKNGNIILAAGDIVVDRSDIEHDKGFSWVDTISVKESDLKAASSIGIASFQNVKALDNIVTDKSDWDGRRLILDLPISN